MRKRAVAASVLASMGILTVGWQIGTATAGTPASTSGGTASGTSGTAGTSGSSSTSTTPSIPSPSNTSSSSASTPAAATSTGLKDGSYTGASEQTPFGNVQVKITVSGGKITGVTALQLTDQGGRSVQISNYAAPILRKEVLSSQSARVSNVNGATYTTDGYLSSVQSALDQATS